MLLTSPTFVLQCLNSKTLLLIMMLNISNILFFRRNKLWLYEWCKWTCTSYNLIWYSGLQNRHNFLCISGEQRRKRAQGEREARVACEGILALLPCHATHALRSSCFRLCSPEICKKFRLFCRLMVQWIIKNTLTKHAVNMCVSYLANTSPFSFHNKSVNLKEIDRHLLLWLKNKTIAN